MLTSCLELSPKCLIIYFPGPFWWPTLRCWWQFGLLGCFAQVVTLWIRSLLSWVSRKSPTIHLSAKEQTQVTNESATARCSPTPGAPRRKSSRGSTNSCATFSTSEWTSAPSFSSVSWHCSAQGTSPCATELGLSKSKSFSASSCSVTSSRRPGPPMPRKLCPDTCLCCQTSKKCQESWPTTDCKCDRSSYRLIRRQQHHVHNLNLRVAKFFVSGHESVQGEPFFLTEPGLLSSMSFSTKLLSVVPQEDNFGIQCTANSAMMSVCLLPDLEVW